MLKKLNRTQNDSIKGCGNYADQFSCSGGFSCDNKTECVFCDSRDSCSSCDAEWCHPFVRDKY